MVVILGIAYRAYSGLPWIQSGFHGVSAAVIGIISLSVWKLTWKTLDRPTVSRMKANWALYLLYLPGLLVTVVTEREDMWLLLGSGLKSPPAWVRRPYAIPAILLTGLGVFEVPQGLLWDIGVFFTKLGAFDFGSGLAIVPFLHAGVENHFGWLNEQEFLDAVAVAMVTPGPVVITVRFIGYLVAGFPGAVVAALGVFRPCYLITIVLVPWFHRIANNKPVKAFVDGITASVIGALAGAVIVIGIRNLADWPAVLMAGLTVILLLKFKRLPEPVLILLAAVAGIAVRAV